MPSPISVRSRVCQAAAALPQRESDQRSHAARRSDEPAEALSGNNPISNISALSGLTSLIELSLQLCQVIDVTPLQGLVSLNRLVLVYNQIVDIAPLVANTGLQSGDYLYLVGNPLSTESDRVHVMALKARGVIVDI